VTRRTAGRREKEEASGAEEETEKEEEEKEAADARPDPGHLGPQGYSIYIMD